MYFNSAEVLARALDAGSKHTYCCARRWDWSGSDNVSVGTDDVAKRRRGRQDLLVVCPPAPRSLREPSQSEPIPRRYRPTQLLEELFRTFVLPEAG